MLNRWADAICSVLERGDELVLITAPFLAAERMIVHGDETAVGSFGVRGLEAEGQKRAGEVFRSGSSQLLTCSLPAGGAPVSRRERDVQLFLELIDATATNLEIFRTLRSAGRGCLAVADLGRHVGEMRHTNRFIVKEDGTLVGEFDGPHSWLPSLAEIASRSVFPVLTTLGRRRFLVERC